MCMRLLGILAGRKAAKQNCCQCPPATPAWSTPFPPVGIQCHSSKTCRPTSTQLVCSFQSLLFNITVPVDRCNIVNGQKYLQDFLKSVTKCLFAMETQKVLVPTWRKRWWFLYVLVIQSQDASFPVWCQARTSGAPVTASNIYTMKSLSYHQAQHARCLAVTAPDAMASWSSP